MRRTLLIFVFCAIPIASLCFAQSAAPVNDLSMRIARIDSNASGFLITVDVSNRSQRSLFLPQSSDWPIFEYRPRINSLDVEQWFDGKTNLSPIGKKLQSINPRVGFLSVGPCRDAVTHEGWIRLSPGMHILDKIQASEPSSIDYGNSACPLRMAHLSDKLRITLTAYSSTHIREKEAIKASLEFALPH